MTNEFKIISEDGLKTLCKAIKKTSTIGEIIDDDNSVTDKTYSSFEIDRRLNTKIDKTQLTTVLDENVTDEQIPGARVVVDELGLKANDSEVVKKTDIATTLDNTVTNEQVAGAKAVNTLLNNKANKMVMTLSQNVDNLVDEGSYYVIEARNAPHAYGWIDVYANTNYTIQLFYPSITTNCEMYIRRRQAGGAWESWQRLCTTTVADVPAKRLAVNNWATGDVVYTVRNGICYVWISALASSTMDTNSQIIVNNLPVPKSPGLWSSIGSNDCTKGNLLVLVGTSGELKNYSGLNNTQYFGSFSYPVAE